MSPTVDSDECKVYFYCEPLQSSRSFNFSSISPSSVSSSNSASVGSWTKHWGAAFDYGKDTVLFCEAGKGEKRRLTGCAHWKDRAVLQKPNMKTVLLGRYTLGETYIGKIVKTMDSTSRYHLTDNNCQKWVKELLRNLRVKVPDELDAETILKDIALPIVLPFGVGSVSGATLGAATLGLGGAVLGASVGGAFGAAVLLMVVLFRR